MPSQKKERERACSVKPCLAIWKSPRMIKIKAKKQIKNQIAKDTSAIRERKDFGNVTSGSLK